MWRTYTEKCLMGPTRGTACGGLTRLGCIQDKISNFGLPLKIKLALNYTFDLLFSFRVMFSSVSTWSLIYSFGKTLPTFSAAWVLAKDRFFTISNIFSVKVYLKGIWPTGLLSPSLPQTKGLFLPLLFSDEYLLCVYYAKILTKWDWLLERQTTWLLGEVKKQMQNKPSLNFTSFWKVPYILVFKCCIST